MCHLFEHSKNIGIVPSPLPAQCIYGCVIPKIESDCFLEPNEEIGIRNWCAIQCFL